MSPGAWLRVFAAKLKARFVQDKANREFDDELQAHLQLLTEQYLRQGMPAEEASSRSAPSIWQFLVGTRAPYGRRVAFSRFLPFGGMCGLGPGSWRATPCLR